MSVGLRLRGLGVLLMLGGMGAVVVSCHERPAAGDLVQGAYVWQRVWTPAVCEAVSNAPPDLARLVVLAAQVGWSDTRPVPLRIVLDYATLKVAGRPVGLALRVTGRPEPLAADGPEVAALCVLARTIVADARSQALDIAEVQVDYDCPERRLGEYAGWIARLRAAVQPTPVRITVLPSWLPHRQFRELLRHVDGCVLQVHWLQSAADEPRLLDLEEAREAVRSFARLGVAFDVALPTYAYVAACDEAGRALGVSAEGPLPNWPRSARLERIRAEPAAMASLIGEWSARRPPNLAGIIWYRLPVAGDLLNWAPATFARVRHGETPAGRALTVLDSHEAALVDVTVTNAGDDDVAVSSLDVRVDLGTNRLAAADGVGGFAAQRVGPAEVRFTPAGDAVKLQVLRPGDRRVLGWVRHE